MGRLLTSNAPLRGWASLELVVWPLGYREAAEFWGISDPRLAVLVHSIVGGTSCLFREARYLLAEEAEIRDTAL
jgi:hypothetical protein